MTLGHLIDEALPRLTNPTTVAFAYWREHLGDVRLDKITPELIALHRDRLLGAACRGHNHKTTKPRSPATVRNYLIELSRLFALAVNEMRVMDRNPCVRVTRPAPSKAEMRPLLREAIHWNRKSRDALLAGDVKMHEALWDRARMYAAYAALELFQPYANELGKRYVEIASHSSAGGRKKAERPEERALIRELDGLIRGCIAKGDQLRVNRLLKFVL